MNKNKSRLSSTRIGPVVVPGKVEHQNNGKQEQIEDPSQRQYQAYEAEHVTCQGFSESLPEGTDVTTYTVRPCPHSPWMVTKTRYGDNSLTLAAHTTLSVGERPVSGRVARLVDQAHQQSWPITIATIRREAQA